MTESNYEPNPAPEAEPPVAQVESDVDNGIADLSLADLFGTMLRHPARTLRALSAITIGAVGDIRARGANQSGFSATPVDEMVEDVAPARPHTLPESNFEGHAIPAYVRERPGKSTADTATFAFDQIAFRPLVWMVGGWVIALFAIGYALRNGVQRVVGDIFPISAFLAAVGLSLFAVGAVRVLPFPRYSGFEAPVRLKARERRRSFQARLYDWSGQYGARMALAGLSLIFTAGAWIFNANNTFTLPGVFCWFFSVFGWSVAFVPGILPIKTVTHAFRWLTELPRRVLPFRISWTAIALLVILAVGGYFRFTSLDAYPPEMTSDHVEKVLDAQRIASGATPVFLPNNGGREIVQFYTLALIHNVFNVPIDFNLLKALTAIEGMLGLLAAWWWGREMVGESDPELGNLTGLIMAALLAVSYWHIMLSRLGLRIVLTPLIVSIILVYFVRALRFNRRVDYVKAGLLLGAGLYMYQAVRMVPIVLVAGLLLALLVPAGAGVLRRRRINIASPINVVRSLFLRRQIVFNFVALVIVAAAVFAPLGRYMVQYPVEFWARTSGRLFGEDTIQVTDPATGQVVIRDVTTQERLAAFGKNIGYFGQNMVSATLMFTWMGDRAWVSGEQGGSPEMDRLTGALFVIGLGLWLVRMIRRRDPGDWLIPFGLVIMLFATALSLAFVIEVPSATRASGAIPFAYGLAGFAGAVILRQAWRTLRGNLGRILVVAVAALIWLFPIASTNASTYVNKSMVDYIDSAQPHKQAGQILRGFEDSTGAPGNAFMIAYTYWWDHRALAIYADDLGWLDHHGILNDNGSYINNIVAAIKASVNSRYEFRPDRQILFFLNQNDQPTLAGLQAWLPAGSQVEYVKSSTQSRDFILLIGPPTGCDWLNSHVGEGASALCPTTAQAVPATNG